MAWKNIKQQTFADDLLVVHSAIEELDDVKELIDWLEIEKLLEKEGLFEKLLSCINQPLTDEEKRINRQNSGTRSIVERTFGVLKLHYGMSKGRYLGLKRNKARFGVMSIAHNIKRGMSIQLAMT